MRTENQKLGRSNRGKGRRWELDALHYCQAHGWPRMKRQRDDHAGDLLGIPGLNLECKDTTWQAMSAALDQAERDARQLGLTRGAVVKKRAGHRDPGAGIWIGRVGAELAAARAAGWRVTGITRGVPGIDGHPDTGTAGAVESRVECAARTILAVCQYTPWPDVPGALDAARAYAETAPGLFARVVIIKRQRGDDNPLNGFWIGTVGAELAAERDRQPAPAGARP